MIEVDRKKEIRKKMKERNRTMNTDEVKRKEVKERKKKRKKKLNEMN